MQHPLYNHCIVELIGNVKFFFFKVLVFCQISRVYVACAKLYCIIVELTAEVLLFAEPWENLFFHIYTKTANASNFFLQKSQEVPFKGQVFRKLWVFFISKNSSL